MLICYKVCFMVPYKTHILCRKFSTLNPRCLMQIVKRRPRKENHHSSANRNFKSFTKRRIEHPRSGLVWDRVLQFYQLCFYVRPFYVWIMPFCEFLQSMSGVDKIIQCTPGFTDTVSSELLSEEERSWRQRFLIWAITANVYIGTARKSTFFSTALCQRLTSQEMLGSNVIFYCI